jgi:ribosomal-protein-alanine N-acetyltransferase
MKNPILETERLILRTWRDGDRKPHALLNADPEVMMYFRTRLSEEESNTRIDRMNKMFEDLGYGHFALELKADGSFIGSAGIAQASYARYTQHVSGESVEIGWRLARKFWGKGYATEAALVVKDFALNEIGLAELVSFPGANNLQSRRVLEKLDMFHDPAGDFVHPNFPKGSELAHHVLYRTGKL